MKRCTPASTFALVTLVTLVTRDAWADPSDADRALATQLFNEGRELVMAKQYDAGCAKLLESHRLDPGGGTILNAAICHELAGKTATAWTEFTEALGWAKRDHNAAREQTAQDHLNALAPKLSRITVVVPQEVQLPELVVVRDGSPLGRAAWGSAVPVDRGTHRIEASAPGRVMWTTTIEIAGDSDDKTATVPMLEVQPSPAAPLAPFATGSAEPAPAPPATAEEPANPRRIVALITLGAGAVALGVGGYFGLRALSKRSESDDACSPICRGDAVTLNDQARSAADVSTVAFGVGLLALGVGGYLFFTSARPSVGKRGAFLTLERAF